MLRDRWGIPHIYARNARDALFAQGFVHAQERLWQMDFTRRLVAGRLAEVLGEAALPFDRAMRTLGLRQVAEQEAAQMPADIALSCGGLLQRSQCLDRDRCDAAQAAGGVPALGVRPRTPGSLPTARAGAS